MTEILIIATTKPLTNALKFLRTLAAQTGVRNGLPISIEKQPVEAITSLLSDLNEPIRGNNIPLSNQLSSLDVTKMAALSITFEVVEKK
jgi:glutamine synthetase type III